MTEYPLDDPGAQPQAIAAAPDGSIWFTESGANKIVERRTDGDFVGFDIPTADSGPRGIAITANGSVWFTESAADKIGELSSTGTFAEYAVPTAASQPDQITIGPDGDPWFTETAGNQIGTVRGGSVAEYPVPDADSQPEGITTSSSGTIWFAEAGVPYVGTITTAGTITQTQLPTLEGTTAVAADAVGNIWFVQPNTPPTSPGILEFYAGGQTVGESFLTGGSSPSDVTVGADGAAWFAQTGSDQIARITYTGPGGITRQYRIGTEAQRITAGPGNTLWFTDPADNAIGRLDLTAPTITSAPAATLTAGQPGTVTINTGGFPAPGLTDSGALPPGMTFTDNGDGTATISGTPAAAAAGQVFPLTITASSGVRPAASQTVSLAVAGSGSPSTVRHASLDGRVGVGRARLTDGVVRVTLACRGTRSQRCAITAELAARRATRRSTPRVVARDMFTLRAGRHRILRLAAGRSAGASKTFLTLIVEQRVQGRARTIRRQTFTRP